MVKELSTYDKKALQLYKEDPTMSMYKLGKKMQRLGHSASERSIYQRLKRSDYLRTELAKIEQYHIEQLHRDDYPLARKRVRKALKDKELNEKEVFSYVKLIYDKVHADKHHNLGPGFISIDTITNIQMMIKKDIGDKKTHTKTE